MTVRVLQGDCREVMATMPERSVDSIVTDPPAGIGFMGKEWDHDKGGRDSWIAWMTLVATEALRVLKPGGHALVWAIPRTSHWTAMAWENAGFVVRDRVSHLFGSGFPKSLDVSKAIDKHGGQSVAWFGPWFRQWREANGITQKQVAALFPSKSGGLTGCVANWELGFNMPTPEQFNLIRDTFGLPFDSVEAAEREVIAQRKQSRLAVAPGQGTDRPTLTLDTTAPATAAARQWQGWGTALKPAMEDWWLLRKPLAAGTVAANVLKFGTGAINVDACRVPTDESLNGGTYSGSDVAETSPGWRMANAKREFVQPLGRWPANVTTDGSDEVLAAFPQVQTGAVKPYERNGLPGFDGGWGTARTFTQAASGGSAARFFYTAKASAYDRNDGCRGMPKRMGPEAGGSRSAEAGREGGYGAPRENHHPTVKPTDLMRYLCRLITPPGGTVLDPFCGSGSTLKAAELEGFSAIGIELDSAYIEIARRRIASDMPLFAEVAA